MFYARLRRYSTLLLILASSFVLLAILIFQLANQSSSFPVADLYGAAQSEAIAEQLQASNRLTAKQKQQAVEHLRNVRDGGALTRGSSGLPPKAAEQNAQIRAAIAEVDAAMANGSERLFKAAYQDFARASVAARANFQAKQNVDPYLWGALVVLALCFLSVAFLLVAKLGRQDQANQQALAQSDQILSAVDNGLFIIDDQLQIGDKKSDAVYQIFGDAYQVEGNFFDFLRNFVSAANMELAREYLELLREGRVLPELITDVNPLVEVPVQIQLQDGSSHKKYLSFNFFKQSATQAGGLATSNDIVVAINDNTKEVQLRQELESTKSQQQERMGLFVGLLHVDPDKLSDFCDNSAKEMRAINSILADDSLGHEQLSEKLDDIFRRAHRVKGDAAALGLKLFESAMHNFEAEIQRLKDLPLNDGRNVLQLTVQLKEMISETDTVRALIPQLKTLALNAEPIAQIEPVQSMHEQLNCSDKLPESQNQFAAEISELVELMAKRQHKHAVLDIAGLELLAQYKSVDKKVREICTQLVRNAVTHGIELPQVRVLREKPKFGVVNISIRQPSADTLQLTVKDDGQGIQFEKIKAKAIERELLRAVDAVGMPSKALLKYLFMPGFSSEEEVSLDAGRGVGLDAVRDDLQALGGRVSVSSRDGRYTKFVMEIPVR